MAHNLCELNLLPKIGRHVANRDTFDQTLASTIKFAVGLVSCDEWSIPVSYNAILD